MGKIAIVTDSNSGITQDQARQLGISVIPMPFYINEKLYLEGITLSQEEFYERLKNDEAISTSQPGPADVCGLWNTLLEKYDEVVHIPMSSGLSASCDTAMGLKSTCSRQSENFCHTETICTGCSHIKRCGQKCDTDQTGSGRAEAGFQYLYHSGNFEIP